MGSEHRWQTGQNERGVCFTAALPINMNLFRPPLIKHSTLFHCSNIFIVHWMYFFSVMLDFSPIFRAGIKPRCGCVFILYIDVDLNHFRHASKLCVVS